MLPKRRYCIAYVSFTISDAVGSRLRLILFYSGGGLTLDGLVALALYLIRLHLHSDLLSMWVMVVWVTVPYSTELNGAKLVSPLKTFSVLGLAVIL